MADHPAGNAEPERLAVGFARLLRAAGLDVAMGSVVMYAEALALTGLATPATVYWVGRTALVRAPEDVPAYDRAFNAFWWGRLPSRRPDRSKVEVTIVLDSEEEGSGGAGAPETRAEGPTLAVRWNAQEVLRHKDFAAYTAAEFAEARRMMADLRLSGALRRSRRRRPSARASGRPDLRRTVRRSLRSGGEPMRRAFTEPGTRPRRIVLICDVSGSMEPYSRGLLRFLHAAVVGRGRIEAFVLGTRLTRITRELSSRDPDAALAKAAGAVADWSGGTRLGDGLRAFNDEWGQRGMARGAVVVILSDGWDRGDPFAVGEQMQRLSRVAHRVVWVNPLKVLPGYSPLAAGMAAALPWVDEFIEGHSLRSLEQLAEVIAR